MTGTFRAIPLLLHLCDAIDRLFIEEVGPFGQMITEEARAAWLARGNKLRTTDVDEYIGLLAKEIDDPERRADFVVLAKQVIVLK